MGMHRMRRGPARRGWSGDPRSSRAVEPAAGAGDGGGLVHHPLADAEVPVNPLVDLAVLVVGYPLGIEANPRNR